MLDHASHGRRDALRDVIADDVMIVEPDSLPYGGNHPGLAGYIALMRQIGDLFELMFEPVGLYAPDDTTAVLRMTVKFTARNTGRSVRLPVVELLEVAGGRVRRSEGLRGGHGGVD